MTSLCLIIVIISPHHTNYSFSTIENFMFDKLKNKWGVSGIRLFLILCTFAIGGSLSGRAAHKLLDLLDLDPFVLKAIVYLVLVTIIWPLSVLLVSIPFGQFSFFRKYLAKMGRKMFSRKNSNTRYSIAP